jgi:formylglycine-generating enzyme required for sulfatase activity
VPQGDISFTDAQQLCAKQGKRLCTAEEWQWTCSSLDAYTYPYGKTFDENRCNSDASRNLEASGARINCFSRFGAFDMVGNIFEWVTTSNNQPALMGGPYSKCQTVSPGMGGEAKSISGLRCCKSN